MALRDVRITLRDRQTTGGSVPSDALFGEPFVNLFDGVLRFSGVTGGSYEPTSQANVFEVGSALYNQKITNRLNINNNFIISGDTGLISTYQGIAGAGLTGKFLSGTTTGFVIANIADIATTTDSYTTAVTWNPNLLTIKTNNGRPDVSVEINTFTALTLGSLVVTGNTTLNTLFATTISGGTILSGSTNLYQIFAPLGTSGVQSVAGVGNIFTGGTSLNPTINISANPAFNNITFSGTATGNALSATTLSGGTILSGSTNLYQIFAPLGTSGVQSVAGVGNIFTGGTPLNPTINISTNPSFNNLSLSGTLLGGNVSAASISASTVTPGLVVYGGAGGLLKTETAFSYDEASDTLGAGKIILGVPGQTGTTATIYGDVLVIGEAISGFTSELYIEDNNIFLNYNPTASTVSTSLGAGWTIQDGSGVALGDVFMDIRGTGTTVANRSFATNLNDIRIRETGTISAPNGSRVLAENDVLDGGSY